MIAKILPGIIRHILTVLGGGFVADGWLTDNELNSAVGAILTLIGVGWSIWQKSRTRTIPGGEFNPKAEVRKALPVQKDRYPRRIFGGNIKNGLVALALIPAFGLGGCADITPHTTVEHGKGGGYGFRKMTHAEAKAVGFTFIDRNSDQVWAWPILLMKGLYEFSK